ncbi:MULTISPECIES: sce7726 family protein [Chromohalobacter]|uniref:sce7726 family protein n=1 Tax=Chromohalobacter TaxID=42054 RepID=UPI001FFDA714|nr:MULTISPECIES: sce7726 family protein [Chromohalobacter]MCK2045615.1 sce7726 family protein [Chromohalobacter moromii]MCT8468312.1 sce7726 family protein [Chromohalobacter canadensis]MCT8471367.1 sce7726 family protein [Chromohalobacter canadensis]MCT8498820.1 sce7726 family protein [Chromohalobacter canadensis]
MKEATFKKHLINWLLEKYSPLIIACEHEYFFGSKRADIVFIDKKGIHAIEIKSKHDDARRLKEQLPSYLASFHSVSVAFDECKIDPETQKNTALGIFLVSGESGVKLKRKAYVKKRVKKEGMLKLVPLGKLKKRLANKDIHHPVKVTEELSRKMNSRSVEEFVTGALYEKYGDIYKTFLLESGRVFNDDDLSILERKSNKISL